MPEPPAVEVLDSQVRHRDNRRWLRVKASWPDGRATTLTR